MSFFVNCKCIHIIFRSCVAVFAVWAQSFAYSQRVLCHLWWKTCRWNWPHQGAYMHKLCYINYLYYSLIGSFKPFPNFFCCLSQNVYVSSYMLILFIRTYVVCKIGSTCSSNRVFLAWIFVSKICVILFFTSAMCLHEGAVCVCLPDSGCHGWRCWGHCHRWWCELQQAIAACILTQILIIVQTIGKVER